MGWKLRRRVLWAAGAVIYIQRCLVRPMIDHAHTFAPYGCTCGSCKLRCILNVHRYMQVIAVNPIPGKAARLTVSSLNHLTFACAHTLPSVSLICILNFVCIEEKLHYCTVGHWSPERKYLNKKNGLEKFLMTDSSFVTELAYEYWQP